MSRLGSLLSATIVLLGLATGSEGSDTARLLTYCLDDVSRLELPDDSKESLPAVTLATVRGPGGMSLRPRGPESVEIYKGKKRLLSVNLDGLLNPNIVAIWANEGKALAINYSDGGAIGGWHTRAFLLEDDTVVDRTKVLRQVQQDFKSRHYCQSRGNNIQALKWMSSDTLLVFTQVYPTSDCGHDLGYIEGYVLDIRRGSIQQGRLNLAKLKRLKGVCLENAE